MTVSVIDLQRKFPISHSKIKSAALKSLTILKMKSLDLNIVFVSPSRMRALNTKYLGHDEITDCISFDHGEIIICPSVAAQNAKDLNNNYHREILLYVVHGILHLAGFDDRFPQQIKKMRMMEHKILARL